MNLQRLLLTLALAASIHLHAQDATAPLSWTASDGRVMQAKFIKLDGESVVIEKDGKEFAVPLAKLAPESVALAKKLGGVVAASKWTDFGPIPPLWVLGSTAFADPTTNGKAARVSYYLDTTPSGDHLFVLGGQMNDPELGVALVSNTTGKVLWRTAFPSNPEGTREWIAAEPLFSNGQLITCSVPWRQVVSDKSRRAQLRLQSFDLATGKVLAHAEMAFDDPDSTTESSGPVAWRGEICCHLSRIGQRTMVATPYFVAEVDHTSLKPLRSTRPPSSDGFLSVAGMDALGAHWTVRLRGKESTQSYFAQPGEPAREMPAPKEGWAPTFRSTQGDGWMIVEAKSPDQKETVIGAFDPLKNAWPWVKTASDWSKAAPGPAKTLEVNWTKDALTIYDASTGDARYVLPGRHRYELLADGRAWLIPTPTGGGPNEMLLVNCATSAIETRITRDKPFPTESYGKTALLFLPGGRVMIADVSNGSLEIETVNTHQKSVTPPRPVTLHLPSPPTSLFAYATTSTCVLMLRDQDRNEAVCAIPLPPE